MYKPGLHIISEFSVSNPEMLKDVQLFKAFVTKSIKENNLTNVGEVYHSFDEGGYTAVICLTESHISIHTWPEYNKVTFDVFLSNYMKYNNDIANKIHDEVIQLLDGQLINKTVIKR